MRPAVSVAAFCFLATISLSCENVGRELLASIAILSLKKRKKIVRAR